MNQRDTDTRLSAIPPYDPYKNTGLPYGQYDRIPRRLPSPTPYHEDPDSPLPYHEGAGSRYQMYAYPRRPAHDNMTPYRGHNTYDDAIGNPPEQANKPLSPSLHDFLKRQNMTPQQWSMQQKTRPEDY